MPTQGLDIGLQIRNNTNYPQQINVMGNPANLLDTANATTEYRWDLTGFVITFENTISVQYKRNIDPTFDTFTWDLDGTSLQGVVIALNNLGIGYFNLYDELGSTYIGTYNQNYAFGDLNIFNPSISTTTTTTTTTIAPTTTTTTTSTTTAAPTSTTTSTTTAAPTTSTTTSTTTNLVYSQFTLGYSALNGNDSCAEFVLTPTSFYAVGGTITLVNGTILYTDTGLTTLVPNGFYSNGSDNWSVVSGNGTLSAQNSCALTTTTTTSTTTAAPTSTTTTTTTAAPTSTTTTTTTAAPTSTTTTTTTAAPTSTTTTTTTAAPTTTSTTTSTTTLPVYSFCLGYDASSQPTACLDYVNCQTTTTSTTTTTTTGAPVPYTIDNAATGSSALACAGATTTSTVYALAGYTVPIVGMIFYDSPSLTTPFIGSVGWRKFTNGVTNYAGEVDINGELTNYVTCP